MNESEYATNKEKDKAGRVAFSQLVRPIAGRLWIARIFAVASAFLAVGPYIALVWLAQILLDAWQNDAAPDMNLVNRALLLLINLFLARLMLYITALTITHFADIHLRRNLQDQIAARISRAPLAWFSQTNSGLVRKAVQDDTADIHAVIAHAPVDNIVAIVSPIVLLGYVFYLNWLLGLIAIATIPIYLGAMAYMMRDMGEKTAEMDTKLGYVSATMVEFVTGISVVKAFGQTGQAHERYRCAAEEFHRFYLAWCGPMLRMSALAYSSISTSIILLVNLGLGTLAVQNGFAQATDLIPAAIIALTIPQSIEVLGNMTWSLQLAGAAALRIRSVLTIPQIERVDFTNPKAFEVSGVPEVVFEDISFSYGKTKAVDKVSLTLAPGSVTALIGPSGSGKSTLATLLARFSDPDQGRITIGGVDLRQWADRDLYRAVGFVLQEPHMLRLSIRDNVRLGRPEASDDQVWAVLRDAHVAEDIAALPDGLDTIYGVDAHLSGGQCQRISIARALLIDPPILILDEATAFADPESESLIQQALTRLIHARDGGRTVLAIAHRPASVQGVDQVAILESGRLSAVGSPADLAEHPLFAALWKGINA
ncbi:ABC transporter ATP-binding protein [Arcanobacterium hippocoleae]